MAVLRKGVQFPASRGRPINVLYDHRNPFRDVTITATADVASPLTILKTVPVTANSTMDMASAFTYLTIVFATLTSTADISSAVTPVRAVIASLTSTATIDSTASALGVYVVSMISTANAESLLNALRGSGASLIESAQTWVSNIETHAASQYDNFGFNSYAFDGTNYLAAAEDGVYQLSGTDDAGVSIEGMVMLPKRNMQLQQFKRTPNMWLGVVSEDTMVLKVEAEGSTYYYTSRYSPREPSMQRVDIGRGLHATFWKFTLTSSAEFDLESVQFEPVAAQRRI